MRREYVNKYEVGKKEGHHTRKKLYLVRGMQLNLFKQDDVEGI